jgi:predicted negative regulator of RcsB-dependent stress response
VALSKWLSFLLLFPSLLLSLELSVQSGKDASQSFSVITLKEKFPFICESIKNDFDETYEIVCAFERRPSELFKPLNNNFFQIRAETRGKNYFIIVKPHHKMQLFPILFDLTKDKEIYEVETDRSKQWTIVGYKESLPILRHERVPAQGFNFPVTFERMATPYVGGLDIHGNPVHMTRVRDVSDYITLKRYYKLKNYAESLELSRSIMEAYPQTVFKSELMVYEIRSLHKLGNYEDLITVAKKFLRNYASDENVPEILAYTANAYAQNGMYTDADYFFDRLFMEHDESPYSKLGLIYKADQTADAGNSKKALEFYNRALLETKDRDIAAQAAFKIASYYVEYGHAGKAEAYARKIVDGYPEYFGEDIEKSLEMMNTFGERGEYQIAADMALIMQNIMQRGQVGYEQLYKDRGIWLGETENKAEALEAMNLYLSKYQYGEFREEVIRAKDALFFDGDDKNASTRLTEYDALIEQYGQDAIGKKALYKKAELLYGEQKYLNVLDMRSQLEQLDETLYPNTGELITNSAIGLMEQALEKDACTDVVSLSQEYNVTLSSKWDAGIFKCSFESGEYDLAKSTASGYLKSKDIDSRMAWLERYIKADFAIGNYQDVINASNELLTLNDVEKRGYRNIHRIRFDAFDRLGQNEGMLKEITAIENAYGLEFDDIERYTKMLAVAQDRKDDGMIITYAQKVVDLQTKTKTRTQSPYIEFTLAQAQINLGQHENALATVRKLNAFELSDEQRARQKYLTGSLLQKLGRNDEAKAAYQASIDAGETSAWGKLSVDAMNLLK